MKLQESIRRILREELNNREEENGTSYLAIEKVLNKIMGKKYEWWKDIKINDILYSELNDTIELYCKIIVDEKWVKKRWLEYRGYKLPKSEEYIRLDDIVDSTFLKELSDNITPTLKYITNHLDAEKTRLNWNQVIPS
jgi:hypothetical protein